MVFGVYTGHALAAVAKLIVTVLDDAKISGNL